MVDLLRPTPKPPWKKQPDMVGQEADLKAVDVQHLDWYLSAPKLRQIVIGEDGFPAPLTVPDPRVFALHKLWLSKRPERDPLKKPKDREQAFLVAEPSPATCRSPGFPSRNCGCCRARLRN